MTLQNGFLRDGSAYLYSDTAVHSIEDGKRLGDFAKCYELAASFPAACVFSTVGGDWNKLAHSIGFAITLPALLSNISEAVRQYSRTGYKCRVLLAAHYDGRPRLFMIAADGQRIWDWSNPCEAVEIDHFACSGNDLPEYAAMLADGFSANSVQAFTDAQLKAPFTYEGPLGAKAKGKTDWLGGKLCCATVTAQGVAFEAVREIEAACRR